MNTFVKANMLDAFDNIQSFKPYVEKNSNKAVTVENTESISLVDKLIEKFAQSFAKNSKPDENINHKAEYILETVDQDKNATLSIDELQNLDSSTVSDDIRANINDLKNKFKLYDKDKSGELSLAEIKKAIGKNQYSLQEIGEMANESDTENEDNEPFNAPSSSFFQTAMNAYKKIDSSFNE